MSNQSVSVEGRNAQALALELIRDAILEGRLRPGERLKESAIAQELGISRTPIREALLALQADGLVQLEQNRGARVHTFTIPEIEQMYDLRALLEGHAARRAAPLISELELLQLRESCDRFDELQKGSDILALFHENLTFHAVIIGAAKNDALAGAIRRATLPLVYSSYCWLSPDERTVVDVFHRRITDALVARDAERAKWQVKEHLLQARDFLISQLNKQDGDGEVNFAESLIGEVPARPPGITDNGSS